ncbi:MAG TPA: PfkB family carbohydrate kinase [Ilumatobacteraceae bacterium]
MIVVAGEALVDLVIDTDGCATAKLGGGPFNAARTIGRLESTVAFLGALSRDRFGTLLHAQLRADNVDDGLVQFTELPTTLASAELDDDGAASYHFYITDTSAPNLHPLPLPDALTILHVGTLGLVLQPMASTLEAVVGAVGDDVLVFLDPNCRPRVTSDRVGYMSRLDRILRRADVVKVSTDDLEFIAPDDQPAGVRTLLDGGAKVVLHTDGGRSVRVHWATAEAEVAVPSIAVVDTIGAGDAFGGAFVAWWHQAGLGRRDLEDRDAVCAAVAAAVEVSAISCTRVGADPPRRAELGDRWKPARS